jgi:uncharacterized protein YdaU (DUF1376 family)
MSFKWMPYPGDYLASTGHSTTEQHGAYLLLIFTIGSMEGCRQTTGN